MKGFVSVIAINAWKCVKENVGTNNLWIYSWKT